MFVKALRGLGWTLIGGGVLILLYLVYLLFFTNLEANRAQDRLLEEFELEFGAIDGALPGEAIEDAEAVDATPTDIDPGDAYAAMWFERPGADEPLVHADPLLVVQGVSLSQLRKGPGHYPDSVAPGQPGNFAVSGHRTTYGAPFYHLDDLVPGDLVHVVDRDRQQWTYEVREQRIVPPTAVWVVGPDPIEAERPLLTLTTCHPRFSAAKRLIVWAELVDEPRAEA